MTPLRLTLFVLALHVWTLGPISPVGHAADNAVVLFSDLRLGGQAFDDVERALQPVRVGRSDVHRKEARARQGQEGLAAPEPDRRTHSSRRKSPTGARRFPDLPGAGCRLARAPSQGDAMLFAR